MKSMGCATEAKGPNSEFNWIVKWLIRSCILGGIATVWYIAYYI